MKTLQERKKNMFFQKTKKINLCHGSRLYKDLYIWIQFVLQFSKLEQFVLAFGSDHIPVNICALLEANMLQKSKLE